MSGFRRHAGPGRDAGSIAAAVPVLAMVLLLLAGLVLDGARQLGARARAVAYAEEAARAGAAAVDLTVDELRLLPDDVVAERVRGYCRDAVAGGAPLTDAERCFVGVEPWRGDAARRLVVVTRVEIAVPAGLLGIVGVRELRASGEGKARPWQGLDATDVR
ncbi:hypothetical protein NUM3379_10380 [Kineococcus sp. NUM-3379]